MVNGEKLMEIVTAVTPLIIVPTMIYLLVKYLVKCFRKK